MQCTDVYQGSIAHRLAARAAIREFEESPRTSKLQRGEVLALAIEQGLMSTLTSFVAVEGDCAAHVLHTELIPAAWRSSHRAIGLSKLFPERIRSAPVHPL